MIYISYINGDPSASETLSSVSFSLNQNGKETVSGVTAIALGLFRSPSALSLFGNVFAVWPGRWVLVARLLRLPRKRSDWRGPGIRGTDLTRFHLQVPPDRRHLPCTVRSDWLTPYYFSTVTFTPGFGDISAKTWVGEFVAMREVISGYTTLGLLRSVRADKKERQNSCQPFARFECALSHACLGFAFV
jgi:hypothetical protein